MRKTCQILSKTAAAIYRFGLSPTGLAKIRPSGGAGAPLTSRTPLWSLLRHANPELAGVASRVRDSVKSPSTASSGPYQAWLTHEGVAGLPDVVKTWIRQNKPNLQLRRVDDAKVDVLGGNAVARHVSPWRDAATREKHTSAHVGGITERGANIDLNPFANTTDYNAFINDMLRKYHAKKLRPRQWTRDEKLRPAEDRNVGLVDKDLRSLLAVDPAGRVVSAYRRRFPAELGGQPTPVPHFEQLGETVPNWNL